MLNKLGKKICAGVCALSFGLGLNVKSDAFLGQLVLATGEMASALWLGSVLHKNSCLRVQKVVKVVLDELGDDEPLMNNEAAKYVLNVNGILSICGLAYLVGDSVQRGLTAVVSRGDKKTEEPRLDDKKSNAKENK